MSDCAAQCPLVIAPYSDADALVTFNFGDFQPVAGRFGLKLLRPADFLNTLTGMAKLPAHKNETRHARFPHPNPPPEGEGANESLREFHIKEEQTMSQFALRFPNSLHGYAKEVAQQDETSFNQFIVTAVAEKLSAMRTEEFFRERAAKAKPPGQDSRQSAGQDSVERW